MMLGSGGELVAWYAVTCDCCLFFCSTAQVAHPHDVAWFLLPLMVECPSTIYITPLNKL